MNLKKGRKNDGIETDLNFAVKFPLTLFPFEFDQQQEKK